MSVDSIMMAPNEKKTSDVQLKLWTVGVRHIKDEFDMVLILYILIYKYHEYLMTSPSKPKFEITKINNHAYNGKKMEKY